MTRLIAVLLMSLTTLAGAGVAQATTTQLAVAPAGQGSGLVGSSTDGTFAFRTGPSTLRYGDATTKHVATATLPAGCNANAATDQTVLLACAGGPPLMLNTRTGTQATAPGGQYLPGASYTQIGTNWIRGTYSNGFDGAATFINRTTGELLSGVAPYQYDLNPPGTPTPFLPLPRRKGTKVLVRSGSYRVVLHGSSLLELEHNRKLVKTLGRCPSTTCHDIGLSTTTAAWSDTKKVYRYNLTTKRLTITNFTSALGAPRIVVQPRQVLVAVTGKSDRRTHLYRLR